MIIQGAAAPLTCKDQLSEAAVLSSELDRAKEAADGRPVASHLITWEQ